MGSTIGIFPSLASWCWVLSFSGVMILWILSFWDYSLFQGDIMRIVSCDFLAAYKLCFAHVSSATRHSEQKRKFSLLHESEFRVYWGFRFWVVFQVIFACGCKLVKLNHIKSLCSVWLCFFFMLLWDPKIYFVKTNWINTAKFEVGKFDGHNSFSLWHIEMHALLWQQGLAKIFNGEVPQCNFLVSFRWSFERSWQLRNCC